MRIAEDGAVHFAGLNLRKGRLSEAAFFIS